jgi:UDP-N-acetylmuramate--alanine ligase
VESVPACLGGVLRDGDVLLTMGAGSIGGVPAKLREAQGTVE